MKTSTDSPPRPPFLTRISRWGETVGWMVRHYPRVPEGRDGLLLRIYDRWSVKLTSAGRGAFGGVVLISVVEMLPGLSPVFPLLVLLFVVLTVDLIRGGRKLKGTLSGPEVIRMVPGERREAEVVWSREKGVGVASPVLSRVPDGLRLIESPPYSPDRSGTSPFLFEAVRRGKWRLDHLRLAERSGAELIDRWSDPAATTEVWVRPRPLPVSAMNGVRWRVESFLREEITGAPQVAWSGEFRTIRPYVAGDPLRAIHPRTSARFGKPMVKLSEEPALAGEEVTVAISRRVRGLPERRAFEAMVSLAGGIAAALLRKEIKLSLSIETDSGEWEEAVVGSTEIDPILDALTPLTPRWSGAASRSFLPFRFSRFSPSPRPGTVPSRVRGKLLLIAASALPFPPLRPGERGMELRFGPASHPLPTGWDRFDIEPWRVPDL